MLDKQQNALVKETKGLKKENDKLAKVALDMSGALKEVGNVQNWAEMLERDFSVVEETLRRVRGGGSEGSWSGSSWSGSESGEVEGDEENVGGGGGGDEMEGMEVTSPSSDFANVDTGNCIKGKGIDRSSMDQTIADGSPPINNTHDTITSTNSSAVPAT